MDTKLTLKLNENVISRAKNYAKKRKTSISKMIENYLDVVSSPKSEGFEITPLVISLSGVIKLPDNYDYKKRLCRISKSEVLMINILFDTNIVIDLLASRDPFYAEVAELFSLADKKTIKLSVSALSLANTHYIVEFRYQNFPMIRKRVRF